MIKVDCKELEDLKKRIDDLNSEDFTKDFTNEAGQRLYGKVVQRTPVGQKPSFEQFATGRKSLAKQKADYDSYWQGYVGGTLRKAWKLNPAKKTGNGYEITVENPMEYASFVEFGHKQKVGRYVPQINKKLVHGWVDGQFFLKKSEIELIRELPTVFNRKIKQVLNEAINDK